jgi:hypothetical protein
MQITMDAESKHNLLDAIHAFTHSTHRRSLRDFQRIAGWINWGLNVQPRLRPGLASLYAKIAGKDQPHQLLWVNQRVVKDLSWLAHHFAAGNGIFMLDAIAWNARDADLVLFTDASSLAMGIWVPNIDTGFSFPLPSYPRTDSIFFFEAYAVCCALHYASTFHPPAYRVAIYSDNANTVEIFNTLKAHDEYNVLLQFVVDLLIQHNIDLRVYHIPGERNTIADALSRCAFIRLHQSHPRLRILPYTPPPTLDGALRK